jgi:DNA-directed RNA polymerase subunit RPC12/RpoP
MSNDFRHSVRVLLCVGCGAPLELDPATATASCQYCGATNLVGPRQEPALAPPAATPLDEGERRRRLARQVGRPTLPPPALANLVPDGVLEPWKVAEVFAVWQSTREEARVAASFDAAERLVYLTMVLANHYAREDRRRQRAMFESALAVVTLPRHQQILRGYLSRAATRDGDLDDAAAWLAPCDTLSDDLETDTAFRLSRAYLDTARGDWAAVQGALGTAGEHVPVADAAAPLALLIRANAVERAGDAEGAATLLRGAMAAGPSARLTLEQIRELHQDWGLCPASWEAAEQAHTVVAARSARDSAGGGVGSLFYWIGLGLNVLSCGGIAVGGGSGVGALALGAVPMVVRLRSAQLHELEMVAGVLGSVAFTVFVGLFTTLPMGLIFWGLGRGLRNAARTAERLRLHGKRARGEIVKVRPTGTEINDVPQVELTLRIHLDDRAPYEATTRLLLSAGEQARLIPGRRIPVRVDPKDPSAVVVETD